MFSWETESVATKILRLISFLNYWDHSILEIWHFYYSLILSVCRFTFRTTVRKSLFNILKRKIPFGESITNKYWSTEKKIFLSQLLHMFLNVELNLDVGLICIGKLKGSKNSSYSCFFISFSKELPPQGIIILILI